jgi:hypothetical protein
MLKKPSIYAGNSGIFTFSHFFVGNAEKFRHVSLVASRQRKTARTQAALATSWMARHPEASATSRPRPNRARPLNQLAQQILRRGGHIADVRHMVTYI